MKEEDGEGEGEQTPPDEPMPARRRGRPVRKLGPGALLPPPNPRADAARCLECPRHDTRIGYCPVRAERCPGRSPACLYGTVLIRAARQARRREAKRNG